MYALFRIDPAAIAYLFIYVQLFVPFFNAVFVFVFVDLERQCEPTACQLVAGIHTYIQHFLEYICGGFSGGKD
jgi:hypothetical protein